MNRLTAWQLHTASHRHTGIRCLVSIAVLALCLSPLFFIPFTADITVMLPGNETKTQDRRSPGADFTALSQSGPASSVFIALYATETHSGSVTQHELIQAATTLQEHLSPKYFQPVLTEQIHPMQMIHFLLDNSANLLHPEQLQELKSRLHPSAIHSRLQQARNILLSAEGTVMKSLIQRDPLGFRELLLPDMQGYKRFAGQGLAYEFSSQGYILTTDQTALLITGTSPLSATDSSEAATLISAFEQAKKTLPPSITADCIGAHVHTQANSTVIEQDLFVITLLAVGSLAVLFFLFFFSARGLFVLLTPLVALCTGLGALALYAGYISALVLGFGSVLVGLCLDFSMHVYFAITRRRVQGGTAQEAIQAVSGPLLFCLLTSCCAFGTLLLSDIPGIRQLAVFALSGLTGAWIFSLFVLPYLIDTTTSTKEKKQRQSDPARPRPVKKYPVPALAFVVCLTGAALCQAPSVTLNPDLRQLSYTPAAVRAAEKRLQTHFAGVRDQALLLTQGHTLQSALSSTQQVYHLLNKALPPQDIVSLSPLLPAFETQTANRQAWARLFSPALREKLRAQIQKQGTALGFAPQAFTPFAEHLGQIPAPLTPEVLSNTSFAFLVTMLLHTPSSGDSTPYNTQNSSPQITLTTLVPDNPALHTLFSPALEQEFNTRFVSASQLRAVLETTMRDDIVSFLSLSTGLVVVMSFLLFGNIRRACLALVPAVSGLAMLCLFFATGDIAVNLFHITALPLVIGLGMDYGIFLVSREKQTRSLATMRAVAVSGLTTLAGFGILMLGRHPALFSLGSVVMIGVGTALVCALVIMPHLLRASADSA